MTDSFDIGSAGFAARIAPDLGGRLMALDHLGADGRIPLIPAPAPGTPTGQKASGFPLIPFGGRLRDALLAWNGADIALPPFPDGSPHLLHGDGARRAWTLRRQTPKSGKIEASWPTPAWPFAAMAWIGYHCEAGQFVTRMEALSLSDTAIPFALGWHPYFHTAPDDVLILHPKTQGALNTEGFCSAYTDIAEPLCLRVGDIKQTMAYRLANPIVELRRAGLTLRLLLGGVFRHLVVHVPPGAATIAIEPMGHPLHHPEHSVLPPGGRLLGTVALSVRRNGLPR